MPHPYCLTFATPSDGAESVTKTLVRDGASFNVKKHKAQAGKLVATKPCKFWKLEEHSFDSFEQFAALLQDAAADQFDTARCVIRGRLPENIQKISRTRRLASTTPRWSNVVSFDLDGIPAKPDTDPNDIHALGAALRDALPGEWRKAGCVAQFTSGHGIKPGIRARLWFATTRPLSAFELAVMFGSRKPTLSPSRMWSETAVGIDTSVWNAVQPNFITNPIFRSADGAPCPDPLPTRLAVLPGPPVTAPSADEIEALREAAEMEPQPTVDSVADGVEIDSPGVILRSEGYRHKFEKVQEPGRHVGLRKMAFALMDFGRSVDGAIADTVEWASKPGNVDPPLDEDAIESNLRSWLGSYVGPIGKQYDKSKEPAASFGAVDDGEDAGPAEFQFWGFGDARAPTPSWIIRDVLAEGPINFMAGQSGAGKTFAALSLAVALASGNPWLGKEVVGGPKGVLYITAEGTESIGERTEALELIGQARPGIPFLHVACYDHTLLEKVIKRAKHEMLKRFGTPLFMTFIDTMGALFDIKDEQDNAEANTHMRSVRRICVKHGTRAMLLHHYGKNGEAGMRGASGYTGAADGIIAVTAKLDATTGDATDRFIAITKTRRGRTGGLTGFELRQIEVGKDAEGEALKAAYIQPVDRQAEQPRKTDKDEQGRAAIRKLLTDRGPMKKAALTASLMEGYGISQPTAYRWVAAMETRGDLETAADWTVSLVKGMGSVPDEESVYEAATD